MNNTTENVGGVQAFIELLQAKQEGNKEQFFNLVIRVTVEQKKEIIPFLRSTLEYMEGSIESQEKFDKLISDIKKQKK